MPRMRSSVQHYLKKQSFPDLEVLITSHRFLEGWGEEVRIAQLHTLNEAVLRCYGLFSEMPTM